MNKILILTESGNRKQIIDTDANTIKEITFMYIGNDIYLYVASDDLTVVYTHNNEKLQKVTGVTTVKAGQVIIKSACRGIFRVLEANGYIEALKDIQEKVLKINIEEQEKHDKYYASKKSEEICNECCVSEKLYEEQPTGY